MKLERATWTVVILTLITLGWCVREIHALRAQSSQAVSVSGASATGTALELRLKNLESAVPSPGLFMSAVQLHFAKLYFAAEARNWDLARFERGEILENLEVVATLVPEERGVGIAGMIDAFKNTQLAALKEAIDLKDRALFREAYRDSIVMCNSCHQATGRPFIQITTPTDPPVSNQQWALKTDLLKEPVRSESVLAR